MVSTITSITLGDAGQQFGDGDWDIGEAAAGQPITASVAGSGTVLSTVVEVTLTASADVDPQTFTFSPDVDRITFAPPGDPQPLSFVLTPAAVAWIESLPVGSTVAIEANLAPEYILSDDIQGLPITCFAAGTLIATARGEVRVEDLRIGDLVVTTEGGAPLKPIRWIGHTRVNLARHPGRAAAAPILIAAGALAEGVPHRDLRVSPEHALFLDSALVPARLLVNGTTIVQELWCAEVTYWHVELDAHGLLVSEGAVSESYFDDGNRHCFDNHAVTALVKDYASHRDNGRYRAAACAPVLEDGPALEHVRTRIAARADTIARAA